MSRACWGKGELAALYMCFIFSLPRVNMPYSKRLGSAIHPSIERHLGLHAMLAAYSCTSSCSSVQESSVTDFILEMCVPSFRWMPLHLMHKNTPRFQDAQRVPSSGYN